tara:strand:+ start:2282 stop:2449 length:168 start_codon:yes stop_codon:yes gene_type:complete
MKYMTSLEVADLFPCLGNSGPLEIIAQISERGVCMVFNAQAADLVAGMFESLRDE